MNALYKRFAWETQPDLIDINRPKLTFPMSRGVPPHQMRLLTASLHLLEFDPVTSAKPSELTCILIKLIDTKYCIRRLPMVTLGYQNAFRELLQGLTLHFHTILNVVPQ